MNEEYEDITLILRLKKNIAILCSLIADNRYNGSFEQFASEEIRQAILAIGSDGVNKQLKDYANSLIENEEI